MSPTKNLKDRFGRAYEYWARIIYPTRRGSKMELIEARIIGVGVSYTRRFNGENVIHARRNNGIEVTLRNLRDVVVIPH